MMNDCILISNPALDLLLYFGCSSTVYNSYFFRH